MGKPKSWVGQPLTRTVRVETDEDGTPWVVVPLKSGGAASMPINYGDDGPQTDEEALREAWELARWLEFDVLPHLRRARP